MRAHVLNGLLILVGLTGAAAWVGSDLGFHLASSAALAGAILWHIRRADRSQVRRGGLFATMSVIVVGVLGFGTGELADLLHVAFALMLVGAGVMMHVRALGKPGDLIDAAGLTLIAWLVLRVAGLV